MDTSKSSTKYQTMELEWGAEFQVTPKRVKSWMSSSESESDDNDILGTFYFFLICACKILVLLMLG